MLSVLTVSLGVLLAGCGVGSVSTEDPGPLHLTDAGGMVDVGVPPAVLAGPKESLRLTEELEILKDPTRELGIRDVTLPPYSERFLPIDGRSTRYGFRTDAFWVRFTLQSAMEYAHEWVLELDYPLADSMEIYLQLQGESPAEASAGSNARPEHETAVVDEVGAEGRRHRAGGESSEVGMGNGAPLGAVAGSERLHLGDHVPFRERPIEFRNLAASIHMDGGAEELVYLRFETRGTMRFPLTVHGQPAFARKAAFDYGRLAAYFAVLLLISVVHIAVGLYQRDRIPLYFSGFALFAVLFESVQSGMLFTVLRPETTYWKFNVYVVAGAGALLFLGRFVETYLHLRERLPRTQYVFRAMHVLCVVVAVAGLVTPAPAALTVLSVFAASVAVLYVATALLSLLRRSRPGRPEVFFAAALAFFLVGVIGFALRGMGLLPQNLLTLYGQEIGMLAMMIVLTLGLAERLRTMSLERTRFSRELQQLVESNRKFVPTEFLQYLGKKSLSDVELGENIAEELTVMFVDIRSFSLLSERMTPAETFGFINSYLSRIAPIVRRNAGFVDKFIGDGVMALFPNSGDDAVRAAIEIQDQISVYNRQRATAGGPPISVGIGIHTGEVMMGTIGEHDRIETTVLSDTVNVAARLESLTKEFRTPVLVSERVIMELEDPATCPFRFLGRVRIKGKSEVVACFELFAGADYPTELRRATQSEFEQGMFAYFDRRFADAADHFSRVLESDPDDRAAAIYLQEARRFQAYGIAGNWDGVLSMDIRHP